MKKEKVAIRSIWAEYFITGLTAFGGPVILKKLRKLAIDRGWLTEREFIDALAMIQLYPGPTGFDMAAFTGYKLRGVPGAITAGTAFILPAYLLILLLSYFYFTFGDLPFVEKLLIGLEATVIGILFDLTLELGQRSLRGVIQALIALFSFVALNYRVSAVLVVLLSLAAGALLLSGRGPVERDDTAIPERAGVRRWTAIGITAAAVLGGTLAAFLSRTLMGEMGLVFFKIGAVAFGNGTTILPLVSADVVDAHKWLTPRQFADGIALGQVTPGPFLITAAFIGYKVGGVAGSLLSTFAIFSPSLVMTMAFTEVMHRVKRFGFARGALAGAMSCFVGLLSHMLAGLASIALHSPATWCLAGLSFAAVRFFKLDTALVMACCLAAWSAISFFPF